MSSGFLPCSPGSIPILLPSQNTQDLSCSNETFLSRLAKFSDPGRVAPPSPNRLTQCCLLPQGRHRPLHPYNSFVARSLQLPLSARLAPCPTLKPNVTASAPRTRYRLLVRLYRVGFPYYVSLAYKWLRISFSQVERSQALLHSLRSQLAPLHYSSILIAKNPVYMGVSGLFSSP